VYDVWVGVVEEADATDGSVMWLHVFHLEAVGNATDSTDRFAQQLEFNLDLQVSGGVPVNLLGNQKQDSNVNWQTDVNMTSPKGAASSPAGAGDLVVWVEKVSGTGTIDFVISVDYNTA